MHGMPKGIIVPITTPFTTEEEVDYPGLRSNMRFFAGSGLQGYLALGSNGENKSLTSEEKIQVLKTIIENKSADQFVMAGCIFESTRETIQHAKEFERLGADFITLLPPSYFKKQMTDDALFRYFSDVADAVGIPCLVYNAPQFAGGLALSISLIKRVSAHPNIIGIKDSSSGNIEGVLFAVREKFAVIAGSVNNMFAAMTMGGIGAALSLANYLPEAALELYDLLVQKDYGKAIALNDRLLQLNAFVSGKGGVAAVKYAMDLRGLVGGLPRMPLLPLGEGEKEAIRTKFQAERLI